MRCENAHFKVFDHAFFDNVFDTCSFMQQGYRHFPVLTILHLRLISYNQLLLTYCKVIPKASHSTRRNPERQKEQWWAEENCNLVRACGTQISNCLACQRLSSFLPWYKTHWGEQTCRLQKALQSEECYWNKEHRAYYGCRKNAW